MGENTVQDFFSVMHLKPSRASIIIKNNTQKIWKFQNYCLYLQPKWHQLK